MGARKTARLDGHDLAVGRSDLAEPGGSPREIALERLGGRRHRVQVRLRVGVETKAMRLPWIAPVAAPGERRGQRLLDVGIVAAEDRQKLGRLVAGRDRRGVPRRSHQGPQVSPEVVEQRVVAHGVVAAVDQPRVRGVEPAAPVGGQGRLLDTRVIAREPCRRALHDPRRHPEGLGLVADDRVLVAMHGLVGQEHMESIGHPPAHDLLALPRVPVHHEVARRVVARDVVDDRPRLHEGVAAVLLADVEGQQADVGGRRRVDRPAGLDRREAEPRPQALEVRGEVGHDRVV